jgi:hypothetical protein
MGLIDQPSFTTLRANKIISLPRLGGLHHRYVVAA